MSLEYKYNKRRLEIAEVRGKLKEYEMKIIKMAGYLADYYIDRAIESDDFSKISSFLIDYFSGSVGKQFDVGFLVSKYKEYGLNEKIEDMYFDIDEWYDVLYKIETPEQTKQVELTEEEYVQYMIEKRKKEIDG